VLQCVAVCCNVLQCVAMCCSVLQRGARVLSIEYDTLHRDYSIVGLAQIKSNAAFLFVRALAKQSSKIALYGDLTQNTAQRELPIE